MNSYNENLNTFINTLDQYDWFCDAELDNLGRFVVYVDRMDLNFIGSTPNMIGGHHVLFHYVMSQPVQKKQSFIVPAIKKIELIEEENEPETNLEFLVTELDRLENICGANILGDIFFEIHDKYNAVTNLSAKYPEVRQTLEELYNIYGFDIIYDELEL